MHAIQAWHPQSENLSILQPLIEGYDLQVDALTVETTLAKRTLKGKDLNCVKFFCFNFSGLCISRTNEAFENSFNYCC